MTYSFRPDDPIPAGANIGVGCKGVNRLGLRRGGHATPGDGIGLFRFTSRKMRARICLLARTSRIQERTRVKKSRGKTNGVHQP